MKNKLWACGLLLVCGVASAALDDQPSVVAGATTTSTPATTSQGVAYTNVQRTLKSQTVVHEYVDGTGTVFAVSWAGPFKPNLQRLLGRHFDAVVQGQAQAQAEAQGKGEAKAQHGMDRAHMQIDDGDLVVVSTGHMGAFQGRAWVRSRLPAGFDPQEMK